MAIYQYSNWFLIPGEMGGSDCSTAGRKPPLGKCWFRWTSHLCSDRFTPSGQWSVLTAGRTCHKIQLWQLNGLQGEPCISVPNSSDELIFVKKLFTRHKIISLYSMRQRNAEIIPWSMILCQYPINFIEGPSYRRVLGGSPRICSCEPVNFTKLLLSRRERLE